MARCLKPAKIVARNMSNLTPAQLEQFESTFRYFDRDGNNTLGVLEMTAALASLGIVYSVKSQSYYPLRRRNAHRFTGRRYKCYT